MFCFTGTFATFRGGNGCYWLKEDLFLIIWLNICSNHEVRIINFLMVFSVLSMTLKSGASYIQISGELIVFPTPLSGTGQHYHKSFEALKKNIICQNLNAQFEITWVWFIAKFGLWQYMFKIEVLFSLLTVVSPQQLWKSFCHPYNEDYTNCNCLGKAWNTWLASYNRHSAKMFCRTHKIKI